MAGKIVVLPEALVRRIAAGEVIERPASIVKELVENSLDANATEISVTLSKGGNQSIRVTDNGEGIHPEDVPLAFSRHGTSKISGFEDLYRVHSFGFRGEALPSIASVSHLEIITRRHEDDFGTKAVFESGEMKECISTGCAPGTSVTVSSIFESVPVRRKFLKSDIAEQGYCLDWITRLALSRTEVRFNVSTGARSDWNIPAARDLSERLALTLGRDARAQMVPASGQKNNLSLSGFVSRPEFSRSNATQIYLYVNGRFVRDHFLNHAVMTAYRRIIEPRRYPMAVLFLHLPTEDVDVNVHPTKMEVRFRNPREIYGLIVEALTRAIGVGFSNAPSVGLEDKTLGFESRVQEAMRKYRISSGAGKSFFQPADRINRDQSFVPEGSTMPAVPISTPFETCERDDGLFDVGSSFMSLRYLGQVAGTYLVFEGREGLTLIDQHAAHERVLFEKLRRQADQQKPQGQRLLLPEVISLPPRELSLLLEVMPIFADVGIELELFGGDSVVVKSMPLLIADADAGSLIVDVLSECVRPQANLPLVEKRDKIFASLACRAAVKANNPLTPAEVENLCRDLDSFPGISTCPHGRPIRISFSKTELEKMFKRR